MSNSTCFYPLFYNSGRKTLYTNYMGLSKHRLPVSQQCGYWSTCKQDFADNILTIRPTRSERQWSVGTIHSGRTELAAVAEKCEKRNRGEISCEMAHVLNRTRMPRSLSTRDPEETQTNLPDCGAKTTRREDLRLDTDTPWWTPPTVGLHSTDFSSCEAGESEHRKMSTKETGRVCNAKRAAA